MLSAHLSFAPPSLFPPLLLLLLHLCSTTTASAIPDLLGSLVGGVTGTTPKTAPSDPLLANGTAGPYTITQNAPNPSARNATIQTKRAGFSYGSPVAGGPYYPSGLLGTLKTTADTTLIQLDLAPELANTALDSEAADLGTLQYDDLQTVEDYTKLYRGEWRLTLPKGPDPGVLTNYTQDLLFSMERLSISPYSLRRLNPASDSLAFPVADSIVQNLTGQTLQQQFQSGHLFYVDYSDQKNLTSSGQYSAAVDAYFYIHPSSGDFLPLAIHSNVGSKLVYTPADSPNDWFLAKLMYNVDDFWFAQWNHLASTHEVVQILWMAAIRTLSVDHPIFVWLDRLMYEVFSIQPLAATILFAPGGAVDEVFAYTGKSAEGYTTNRYFNAGSGRVKSNYFLTDLQNRGLINSNTGPALKSFPFYEDANTIYSAIESFFTSFVNSYYSSDAVVAADSEIQNWVIEAQGPAKAIEFPNILTRQDLVSILTHMAHLASTAHHTINTNELLSVSSTLPFHPPSLYSQVPTSKGATNIVKFLPPYSKVKDQFSVAALFARPLLANTSRSLKHMFDSYLILQNMNSATKAAAATFKQTMSSFSQQVRTRTFDGSGLSQGMPFLWQALDPSVAPYSITT